jgi:hypothetical protein
MRSAETGSFQAILVTKFIETLGLLLPERQCSARNKFMFP